MTSDVCDSHKVHFKIKFPCWNREPVSISAAGWRYAFIGIHQTALLSHYGYCLGWDYIVIWARASFWVCVRVRVKTGIRLKLLLTKIDGVHKILVLLIYPLKVLTAFKRKAYFTGLRLALGDDFTILLILMLTQIVSLTLTLTHKYQSIFLTP